MPCNADCNEIEEFIFSWFGGGGGGCFFCLFVFLFKLTALEFWSILQCLVKVQQLCRITVDIPCAPRRSEVFPAATLKLQCWGSEKETGSCFGTGSHF